MPQSVVLVIGMHRSGTSMTAEALQALGLRLSQDLLDPNEFNERGYFESHALMALHDRMLAALRSSWRLPTTTAPFPAKWWGAAEIAPHRASLRKLIESEVERTGGLWVAKDPRASRLLPVWNAILDEIGLDAAYVLSVRDPVEVAASLKQRDGIDAHLSELLWLEHNLAALDDGGKRIKAIVPYANWLDDGHATARKLARLLALPAKGRAVREAVKESVVASLRHHSATGRSQTPFVDDLYRALASSEMGEMAASIALMRSARDFADVAARTRSEEVASAHPGATIYAVERNLAWRNDVSEADVLAFADDPDRAVRFTARVARSRTSVRNALADAVRAAQVDDFSNPVTMNAVRSLVPISDVDTPYLYVLRHQMVTALEQGGIDRAIDVMDELFRRAYAGGVRAGDSAAEAFSFLDGDEVSTACETIARSLVAMVPHDGAPAKSIAIVFAANDAATRDRALDYARRSALAGWDVVLIATEPCDLDGVWSPGPGTPAARLRAVVGHLIATPTAVRAFLPLAQDPVARIAAHVGGARTQYWQNGLVAGPGGRLDEDRPPLPEELERAVPLDRATLGIPVSAPLLATVGRLEKCAHPAYLEALDWVLTAHRDAWLVLCGADAFGAQPLVHASFQAASRERVRFLAAERWREAVKACDTYCDTMPWTGAKGVQAAIFFGIPVVSLCSPFVPCVDDDIAYATVAGDYLPGGEPTGLASTTKQ